MQKALGHQGIKHRFYIIEQDDQRPFNRGALLNAGAMIAHEHEDYCVFHDVDMVPEQADYRWASLPLSLVEHRRKESQQCFQRGFYNYFGGVTLIDNDIFQRINGFSNRYFGWGCEDNDLLLRLHYYGYRAAKDISGSYCVFEHADARSARNKPLGRILKEKWFIQRNFRRLSWFEQTGKPHKGDGLNRLQNLLQVRKRWSSGPCVHAQVRIAAHI